MIPLGIFAATRTANLSPPIAPLQTFAFTGEEQTFVNTKYKKLTAKIWGGAANGGWYGGGRWGGGGGFAQIEYPLAPGDIITVMVGGGGKGGPRGTNIPGGWPDGGNGTIGDATGGGGGGSSRIFVNQTLVAVAGGGGAGCGYSGWGGSGGGTEGDFGAGQGRPGTQTNAGYVNGTVNGTNEDGGNRKNGGGPITYATRFKRTGGHGGDSDQPSGDDGGAGGGGYFGGSGGGGDAAAGGGGSGFAHPSAISALLIKGTAGGGDPPGITDPAWPGGLIARGTDSNTDKSGGDGYIWISLS